MIPEYVKYCQFPVEITVTYPGARTRYPGPVGPVVISISEHIPTCYSQLRKWLMINSYWYYVLGDRKVHDLEFDHVKLKVIEMEEDESVNDALETMRSRLCLSSIHPFSSGNRYDHRPGSYPVFVQEIFADCTIDRRKQRLSEKEKEDWERFTKSCRVLEEQEIRRKHGTVLEFRKRNQ